MKLKDLTGVRFGKLVATGIERAESGETHWVVRCDCGATALVAGRNLRRGATRHCGCLSVGTAKTQAVLRSVGADRNTRPPEQCETCARWSPCVGSDLGGQCAAGMFLRGKPWLEACQVRVSVGREG